MEHNGRNGVITSVERGKQLGNALHRNRPSEPTQAGDEDQLQLSYHRAFDPDEQVMKCTIFEMILDPGATHPADPAVDHDDLPMIDVPQARQVPLHLSTLAEWPPRHSNPSRAGNAHLNPGLGQLFVERA